jgi:hypothetical protein
MYMFKYKCDKFNKTNEQVLVNLNRKKYYLYVIEQNKKIFNSNLPRKYPPTYFNTSYNRIYEPNISQVPN